MGNWPGVCRRGNSRQRSCDSRRRLKNGISFRLREAAIIDPFGRREIYPTVEIDSQPMRVDRLVCHTHPPPPIGPSRADYEMLRMLNQSESIIFEINGDPQAILFRLPPEKGEK